MSGTQTPSNELLSDSKSEKTDLESSPPEDIERPIPPVVHTKADESYPTPPPDGGLQAWLAVLGGFCTIFASFGWINCIGVFQSYYQNNLLSSYSPSTVAWIPCTESFMMFVWGTVVGMLADNRGPKVPILIGSFLHVFGLMMTSISSEYYQIFLAQSLCSAIGCSFLFFPTLAAIGTWFSRHTALAYGIAISGSSIGGVIVPIMVQRLIPQIGFGWALRSTAFLILGLLVVGNLTLKSRLPPPRKGFRVGDFLAPFKEKPFALLTSGAFFIYLGGFLPFTFIIVQARKAGMEEALAGYLVPVINAASTFGRIVPAQAADMFGVFNVMILHILLSTIFVLGLWLPSNSVAPLITFAALYGFTSGCVFSILPAMVASISDVRKLGARSGSLYAVSAVGALIGSPIAGAIVNEQNGGYSGLIIFSGVALFIGTVLTVFSRQSLVGLEVLRKA